MPSVELITDLITFKEFHMESLSIYILHAETWFNDAPIQNPLTEELHHLST